MPSQEIAVELCQKSSGHAVPEKQRSNCAGRQRETTIDCVRRAAIELCQKNSDRAVRENGDQALAEKASREGRGADVQMCRGAEVRRCEGARAGKGEEDSAAESTNPQSSWAVLISSLMGPYEGRINDMNMLEQSGLKQKLRSVMGHLPAAERRYLYGDKGYFAGYYGVMGAVKAGRGKALGEKDWYANVFMSTYRVEVEHAFGTVRQLFRQVYSAKELKLGLTPVAAMYEVAVLLTNCHTCFHGSQTNFYFGVLPPSLDTYLRLPGQSIE